MEYRHRQIEPCLSRALERFPAVVLTGPRRAGKTCLLRHFLPEATYVQLEDPDTVSAVKSDPRGFLDALRLPAVIDEIQQAPELFPYIRSRIDAAPEERGRWILTGSQESSLMRGVSESMAGRAAILRLAPFSVRESPRVSPFAGGYPEALAAEADAGLWFSSYVQTYLERDVRSVLGVRDLGAFHRFVRLLATRHGQMLNKTALASPLGISVPTVSRWLDVLEISGLVVLVPPYFRNAGKRLVKTPKFYFSDSGIVCHLLGIRSPEELAESPFHGAVFEGFVASEVLKAQISAGLPGEIWYFRDEQGLEVDLLVSPAEGRLVLAECKATATPVPSMATPMRRLAAAFGAEAGDISMHLVHLPSSGAPLPPTLAPGVQRSSVGGFLDALFPA